jgi:hypothetical protein
LDDIAVAFPLGLGELDVALLADDVDWPDAVVDPPQAARPRVVRAAKPTAADVRLMVFMASLLFAGPRRGCQ